MSYKYLDLTGLSHFWDKIKAKIPTKTSQLTNDSHFNYSSEVTGGTIDALATFTSGKPGLTGSISLAKKSSGVGSEIPAGWYNYYFAPHRSGVGGDNGQYGTIILTPMNFAGKSWILRRSNVTNVITEVKEIITRDQLSNYIVNSNFYINTHPENQPVLIPFMHNDIAFLTQRGGSCKIYYDGVEKTVGSMNNMFDGSPSYMSGIKPTTLGVTEIVIELTLHQVFAWTNTIYCDFGSGAWRAKNVKIEVMNTNYSEDVWTVKGNATGNSYGNVKTTFTHTPVGATNAGGGFNKIKFTFSSFNSDDFRISQLGVYNYGSMGLRETSMSRGRDDAIFRSITPFYNNSYSLGSDTKKWANVYATTFQGNATSATKATQDSDGNAINTTYYKASNPNGYTSNTGTVTSVAVKMNNTTKGTVTTSGTIDLGTVITAHQDISGKQDKLTTQTAYTSKGSATKVPQITTNSLGQVTGITEVTITQPTVNNGTLTIQKNGTNVQTFSANQSGNATANITVPTKTSELTNDSCFITNEHVTDVRINGTSILGNKVADIITNTAYNSSTNKIATMADVSSSGDYIIEFPSSWSSVIDEYDQAGSPDYFSVDILANTYSAIGSDHEHYFVNADLYNTIDRIIQGDIAEVKLNLNNTTYGNDYYVSSTYVSANGSDELDVKFGDNAYVVSQDLGGLSISGKYITRSFPYYTISCNQADLTYFYNIAEYSSNKVTSISSSSTNTQYPSALAVYNYVNSAGGVGSSNNTIENVVSLTKAEYDALQTKETKTLYNITDDYDDNGPTAIPNSTFTINTGTLETNHSYKNGKAVNLNFTMKVNTTAGQTLVLLTLPSGLYPTNSAVACFASVNGILANSWIRNQTGEICVVPASTLTNIEIKIITTYIV